MPRTKPNTMIIQIRDVPSTVHAEARRLAFEQGISLNKWLIWAITRETENSIIRLATQQTKSGLTAGKE